MPNRRACLLFDYYKDDEFTHFNHQRFKAAAAGLVDYFPVNHVTDTGVRPMFTCIAEAMPLTNADIFESSEHRKDYYGNVVPGNRDLKILAACRKLPGYDYYISVEYDVIFLGDAKDALSRLLEAATSCEFGASRFTKKQDFNRDWIWWPTLKAPAHSGIDLEPIATSAFMPVVSFSSPFADLCCDRLADGWAGHYEALLPTLAEFSQVQNCRFQ